MNVIPTQIEGLVVIEPKVHGDERGFFLESFNSQRYLEQAGIDVPFVQDNHSRSKHGVLRGLHFQIHKPQAKLVRCVVGEVFDVAVDLRKDSSTYGQWFAVLLSAENKKQLYVPPGFAHGFQVTTEFAEFEYKCSDYYAPDDEGGILWSDPDLAIPWPVGDPAISEKDLLLPHLADLKLN